MKTKLCTVAILYKLMLFYCDSDPYQTFLLASIMKLKFNCKNREVKILKKPCKEQTEGQIAPSNDINGIVSSN